MMNSEQPLVSIILPTYNGSRYLAEAIESCLAQTYGNWELIVVDDCSQDMTHQIISQYVAHDPRIRTIRHETNKRLPGALNTGHAAAQGDYMVWTSDDNRFLPRAIEELTSFLEQNPEVGLVYADCVVIDEDGRYVQDFPAQPPSRLAYLNALGACFMYRSRVYEAIGPYDAQLFLAEDYDYWLRVYRQFELAPIHKVLYEYRWHGQSLSSGSGTAVGTSVERTLRRHLPYLHHSSRQDRARGWIVCAGIAARRRAPLQVASAFIRALWIAPIFSVGYVARKLVQKGLAGRFQLEMKS
jgi:glycosyltransferase involved in cell wall biosynthesis